MHEAPPLPPPSRLLRLTDRGVVRVLGPDAGSFLQGLWTHDIERARPGAPVHAAMLTPQGKYLFDAIIFCPEPGSYLLDTATPVALARRLSMYRLRANVTVADDSAAWAVTVAPDGALDPMAGAVCGPDPRLPALGLRALVPMALAPEPIASDAADWLSFRLGLGVPDLSRDLVAEKDFALEGLLDELNGVDFHKGCYVGQEMTSRMKRRTTVRTKLCRVRFDGPAPAPDTPIQADGWEVGRTRSMADGVGLALVRFDRALKAVAEGHTLMAGPGAVRLDPPDWLVLPETASA